MPGLSARLVAATVVMEVIRHQRPLDETLDRAAAGEHGLDPRDWGLMRAIATTALRRLGTIRRLLAVCLAEGLPKKSGDLEAILVCAIAQMLFLDVPDHAAVDLAVEAARRDTRTQPYAKLVNGVLRRIGREKETLPAALDPMADTPDWLARRWIAQYGPERARRLADAHRVEAAVDLSVKADAALWAERLDALLLPSGTIRLRSREAITSLEGFGEGAWWVQDAAAALPARLLAVRPGERVGDLCAAPGGKTAQLAATGADVTAVDRSATRLETLKSNMARLGLVVDTLAADALGLDVAPFDAVLLDAPCSATGTLRRHPDVAWTKGPADIGKLADLQRRLLDKAVMLLKPGGRLVYCTCSLEREEGEDQIAAFLARHPEMERLPIAPDEVPGLGEALTPHGELRTLPFMLAHAEARLSGLDGFFVARLNRRA
jgi:16S rRNA (cytosine967-C5)-methyltransferase